MLMKKIEKKSEAGPCERLLLSVTAGSERHVTQTEPRTSSLPGRHLGQRGCHHPLPSRYPEVDSHLALALSPGQGKGTLPLGKGGQQVTHPGLRVDGPVPRPRLVRMGCGREGDGLGHHPYLLWG